jgi:alpha-L-rhamnosidase
MSFRSIHAEVIEYPVRYEGSFESSDPLLNRIWETSAYTAHLCMQDDIWDAPKRDRGRWAGDLDIESRTILTTFGDTFLLEDTLRRLPRRRAQASQSTASPATLRSGSRRWLSIRSLRL